MLVNALKKMLTGSEFPPSISDCVPPSLLILLLLYHLHPCIHQGRYFKAMVMSTAEISVSTKTYPFEVVRRKQIKTPVSKLLSLN